MECPDCSGPGVVYVQFTENVTHEMALDAGYPEMEGMEWDFGYGWVDCEKCGGTGKVDDIQTGDPTRDLF